MSAESKTSSSLSTVIVPISNDNPLDLSDEIRDVQKWLANDNGQYIYIGLQGIVESFKIFMASLLAITVVQRCDNSPNKICSFTDAFKRDDVASSAVIINGINIFAFVIFYIVELMREVYLIKHLDINKYKGDLHLPNVITAYPKIKLGLKKHNVRYDRTIKALCYITVGNWIISITVVGMHWYSIKTVLSLLTNILLITTKLWNARTIASTSIRKNIAISAYMKEFASFNVIDKDYLKDVPANM
jgi:hypothetical protein